MTKQEILTELREVIRDKTAPYLWSDTRLLRLLSEGDDRFCELTGFFLDVGTYQITTEDGVKDYAIPSFSRIIKIINVWDGDRRLTLYNQRQRPTTESFVETPTRPNYFQTDKRTGYLTLFSTPEAGVVLDLEVWRRAVTPFKDIEDFDSTPETPDVGQDAMIEWAAAKCYSDHDSEKLDLKKAADHAEAFKDYVSQGKRAFSRAHRQSPQVAPNPLYVV